MSPEDLEVIKTEIAPRVQAGRCALLLGAGYSCVNSSVTYGKLPSGDGLINDILGRCGKKPGLKTTLKDAYQYGKREDKDFQSYFVDRFTVNDTFDWQRKLFEYAWTRIYTTNIDNVLNVSHQQAEKSGRISGEFKFFNYCDEGIISNTIGSLPIITIHGTILKIDDGFIFANLEYAKASVKILDWHNDLAAWMLAGGLIVVGNQLDESDSDTYLSRRESNYGISGTPQNWIVMPDPDPIKADNYRAAGFYVFDAKAQDFFEQLYKIAKPQTIGEIVIATIPTAKRAATNIKAMTWFKNAFSLVFDSIERAKSQTGITRHYLTGVDPEWFYIVNQAYAETSRATTLKNHIQGTMATNATGVGILHVLGPSGSGKTTAIRSSLADISRTTQFIYEFDSNKTIDEDLLKSIIERFQEKSIFVFYSAADYYYAIAKVADRLKDKSIPYCLFILEDRLSDYSKSARHLDGVGVKPIRFYIDSLQFADAKSIAIKMEEVGLTFKYFSEFDANHRAKIILDKERGFSGDLLSTMFSLTTHENFEKKIYQDYKSVSGFAAQILNLVAIINSRGHDVPIEWIAGALNQKFDAVTKILNEDLAGIVILSPGSSFVKCRHRIIATYYFDNCIQGKGDIDLLLGTLIYLSRQFSVPDIAYHPLSYRVYRDLITFNFIYDKYFPSSTRSADCERTYHELQKYYGSDGIFWLQFGRFYRRMSRLEEAVACFRIGLEFYESFQTKHALGQALVEQYIETGCANESLYNEGVEILDRQRVEKSTDPYPITTLLDLLVRIQGIQPSEEVSKRIKECVNSGIKRFSAEPAFMSVAKRAMVGR